MSIGLIKAKSGVCRTTSLQGLKPAWVLFNQSNRSHTPSSLSVECIRFVNVQLQIPGKPQSVHLGHAAITSQGCRTLIHASSSTEVALGRNTIRCITRKNAVIFFLHTSTCAWRGFRGKHSIWINRSRRLTQVQRHCPHLWQWPNHAKLRK